ncbi:MAG: glycoside hydrolase family 27 protein [Bryobacteraceae bacterium]|nr:glycoside hydrolase family 27 protein [Bryobacteraceae bacterium]
MLLSLLLAADLAGTWVARREMPPGAPAGMRAMESVFTFERRNGAWTGTSGSMMGQQKIGDIAIDGDNVRFTVEFTLGGETRPMKYTGKFEGEELVLTMTPPPGFGPGPGGPPPGMGPGGPGMRFGGPMRAKRLTAEEIAAREAARLKPMPLPAKKTLAWNGLAATPPMGWNSYNKFRTNITDREVREIADAMVSTGMRDAGYTYLVIDDGWEGERDTRGRLQPNSKFPDMKATVDYIHSKGLKAGLWTSPGPRACNPMYQGSYGHEEEDAKQWAEWGFDYIKYDWCSAGQIYTAEQQPLVYQKMAELLRATGRPIVLSICQYGDNKVFEWGPAAGGNLWRTTFDIRDTWDSMAGIGFRQSDLAQYARPGHWNDPDMLEVGNGGMTDTEYRTHFTLWAMAAAPLMAGNDVRSMSAETKEILLNRDVIAVNQDKLGKAGRRVAQSGDTEVWLKPLDKGEYALALFNRGAGAATVTADLAALELDGRWRARDLWKHTDLLAVSESFSAEVPSHGVVAIRLSIAK